MRSIRLLSICVVLLALCVGTAHAQSQVGGTSPLDVFVEVQGVCEVFTDAVAFPGYDPAAGSQAEGFINVNCAEGLPYWIALDIGQNYQPDWDSRGMVGPSAFLAYQLFDPNTGAPWGDGGMPFSTNPWETVQAFGIGIFETFQVRGEIFGGQGVEPGFYFDTVQVTIWY